MAKCTFCGKEEDCETRNVEGYEILTSCEDCEREIREKIITCSICGENFHESEVNIIDYDLDLCVSCEKAFLEKRVNHEKRS